MSSVLVTNLNEHTDFKIFLLVKKNMVFVLKAFYRTTKIFVQYCLILYGQKRLLSWFQSLWSIYVQIGTTKKRLVLVYLDSIVNKDNYTNKSEPKEIKRTNE